LRFYNLFIYFAQRTSVKSNKSYYLTKKTIWKIHAYYSSGSRPWLRYQNKNIAILGSVLLFNLASA